MLVLIVDDSRFHRGCIRRALPGGWEIAEANNGEEALGSLAERRADIMFLDLNMPVKSGYEVLESLQAADHRPDTIFVVSADIQPEAQARVKAMGINDFIPKPFKGPRLLETLALHGLVP